MIRRIKERLNITTTERDLEIESLIDQMELYVLTYCNLETIPVRLNSFIENKVVESLLSEHSNIKSITEGDTSITYQTETSVFSKEDKMMLRGFRKTR